MSLHNPPYGRFCSYPVYDASDSSTVIFGRTSQFVRIGNRGIVMDTAIGVVTLLVSLLLILSNMPLVLRLFGVLLIFVWLFEPFPRRPGRKHREAGAKDTTPATTPSVQQLAPIPSVGTTQSELEVAAEQGAKHVAQAINESLKQLVEELRHNPNASQGEQRDRTIELVERFAYQDNQQMAGQATVRRSNVAEIHRMVVEGRLPWWILQSVEQRRFDPLILDAKEDPLDVLPSLFMELSTTDQQVFKDAAVSAVVHGHPSTQNLQVLQDLTYLALRVGAINVIPALGSHQAVRQAYETLRGFYWDGRFNPEHTPDLFLALCKCEPAGYPFHLPRFLSFSAYYNAHRKEDFWKATLDEFVGTVGWNTIYAHMHEVPYDDRLAFLRIVGWPTITNRLDDISDDILETFLVRALTWPLVFKELPTLDPDSVKKLVPCYS